MAIDKLSLYNNALLMIGERKLSAVDEERAPRRALDNAWDLGAVDYCLELIKPVSQRLTALLNSPSVSSVHGLDSVHTLPSDYITVVGVYLDDKLDQPINRYLIDGTNLTCEFDTVYLRYVSNSYDVSTFNMTFAMVVSSYLAKQIATRIAPDEYDRVAALHNEYVQTAIGIEATKEAAQRAKSTNGTLSADWIKIYNDALTMMGLGMQKINQGTNDSIPRTIMDSIVDAGLVQDILEDIGWYWAIETTKSDYNTSVEPDWGYIRAHDMPDDCLRLDGVFQDEYMRVPLKAYHQENDVIYTDFDTIYIQYVTSDFLTTPSRWPMQFRRLVAAKLAMDAAPSIPNADLNAVMVAYNDRDRAAKSSDAVQSPPRKLASGSWANARFSGRSRGGRPGDY